MYLSVSLMTYIDEWLTTYKETTVKQSTYDKLITSIKALKGFEIACNDCCGIIANRSL